MSSSSSMLTPTQRYAAAALFGMALHQAQIHQTRPLGSTSDDDSASSQRNSNSSSSDCVSEDPQLWVHESSNLLRPVFRFLDIDKNAWNGLEETAGNCSANHHVGAFLRLLSEDGGDASSDGAEQQLALSKGVDAMVASMEKSAVDFEYKKEKQREYESECREKFFSGVEEQSKSELDDKVANLQLENLLKDKDNADESLAKLSEVVEVNLENQRKHCNDKDESLEKLPISGKQPNPQVADANLENEKKSKVYSIQEVPARCKRNIDDKQFKEIQMLGSSRKVTVLYEILSACLANKPDDSKKSTRQRKGYDARHRVALRLLATWFDIKWIQMEAIETMVACSAMALLKEEESKEETQSPKSKWAKWKRGGIIGAAALTGGALMAITGGLAAPAIAAGFGALAPTLGTIIPVIGAGGFAAAASAAGSVAGSVAVAASFGAAGAGLTGSKVARRIGDVNEFEFKDIGDNHNQGRLAVEILVSGFVFEEEDFMRPWEGLSDCLERYALKWESNHLIAVSTAIQDFLTSRLAIYLMKQGAMLTVLNALLAALAWPATLLMATDIIDSKWAIAVDRSDKAGKLLAEDVLLKGLQGHRPVTLVGFSLGARVIFKCLQCLAESGHNDGLVERVVLLGAPVAIQDEGWEAARKVVAGRFINAYSTNDWMLGVAFRASLLTRGLAGIQPIDVPGIENVDVTEVIEGHSSYLWATQGILERLELDTYYPVFSGVVMKP